MNTINNRRNPDKKSVEERKMQRSKGSDKGYIIRGSVGEI